MTVVRLAGDLGVAIDGDRDTLFPRSSPTRAFCSDGPAALRLGVRRGTVPPCDSLELLFHSSGPWRVFRSNGAHAFGLYLDSAKEPYEVAVIDFAEGTGELHLSDSAGVEHPFEFPLDEIVFSKLLGDRDGTIVHACGASHGPSGSLLVGRSGAGKSTFASLVDGNAETKVLNDDRVAVRMGTAGPEMHGTPWSGSAALARPLSSPLGRIVFLGHAPTSRNEARELGHLEAAARLVALSVIPYWDRPAAERAVAACVRLTASVPCYELLFTPDSKAVERLHELDHS